MKAIRSFNEIRAYSDGKKPQPGGYIIRIISVEEYNYDDGDKLIFKFDVAEGTFKDYFQKNYDDQNPKYKKWKGIYRLNIPQDEESNADNWIMRRFKSDIEAIQLSNDEFEWRWDESELIGKTVGALFQNREYRVDGKTGFYLAVHSFIDVDRIRKNEFTIPADRYLEAPKPLIDFPGISDDENEDENPFF